MGESLPRFTTTAEDAEQRREKEDVLSQRFIWSTVHLRPLSYHTLSYVPAEEHKIRDSPYSTITRERYSKHEMAVRASAANMVATREPRYTRHHVACMTYA